jgi:hypothetical protein
LIKAILSFFKLFKFHLKMRLRELEDPEGVKRALPLNNYLNGQVLYDTLHTQADRVRLLLILLLLLWKLKP